MDSPTRHMSDQEAFADLFPDAVTTTSPLFTNGGDSVMDEIDDMQPMHRKRSATWHAPPIARPPQVMLTHEQETTPVHVGPHSHLEHLLEHPNNTTGSPYGSTNLLSPDQLNITGSNDSLGQTFTNASESPPHQAKRNPWGNASYSELITQAINSMPRQRATLAQIYEWFIANIPYFRERADTTSAAGWKNSVRHNLSLHQRFMRVPNEEAGKSSWWMVNPEKPTAKHKVSSNKRRNTASAAEQSSAASGRGINHLMAARDRVRAQIQQRNPKSSKVEENGVSRAWRQNDDCSVDALMTDPNVLRSGQELAGSLLPYAGYRDRTRSNVSDYAMYGPGTSMQTTHQESAQYFGNDLPQATDDFVPNFMSGTATNDMSDIIDNTMRLQVEHQSAGPSPQISPYSNPNSYNGVLPTHQPQSQHHYPQLTSASTQCAQPSPLWSTGQALTCDVAAVIRHELAAGTTNFDFDMDFKPSPNV